MKKRRISSGCAILALTAILPLSGVSAAPLSEPIKPLPAAVDLSPEKVSLGEKLFNDKRFSGDNSLSCASCHDIENKGGADNIKASIGIRGELGLVNAPSVLNASHNFRQFWDGRAIALEDQIGFVIDNPVEFGSSWDEVLQKLTQDAALVDEFRQIYPDGLTKSNIGDAIAVFERSLASPSRFDRYLKGDAGAISTEEREGYERFKSYGCISCHQGMNVGGNMYQKFGILGDYFADRGDTQQSDYGRFNVTGKEADRFFFKVPSLRNVALTAPYFHDGTAETLEQAVDVMFRYQLGRAAPVRDKQLIIAFLKSLTGERYEAQLVAK